MKESVPPIVRRVVIALDHCRQDRHTLLQAVDLADRLHAELVALFVEDEQLLQVAQLPFSQEVSRTSGLVRKLDPGTIRRHMTRQIDELQELLKQSVGLRRVNATFKVVRGRFAIEALAAAGETDVVFVSIVSQGDELLSGYGWPQSSGRESMVHRPKAVWSVFDGSPISTRALDLAGDASSASGASLIVAVRVDFDQDAQQLHDAALEVLKGRSLAVQFLQFPSPDSNGLMKQLRDRSCMMLMVSHEDPLLAGESGRRALETVSCPVVLVR